MRKATLYSCIAAISLLTTACGGSSEGFDPEFLEAAAQGDTDTFDGTLTGQIRDFYSFDPVPGAEVVARATQDGAGVELGRTQLDSEGTFTLPNIPLDTRVVLTADADNFGVHSIIVDTRNPQVSAVQNMLLIPAHGSVDFDPTAEASVGANGAFFADIPANALVRADGSAPVGEVTAEITRLDPSSAPEIIPGDYQTWSEADGTASAIESYGALTIELRDSEGEPVNLAEDQTATIRIPLASGAVNAAAENPLFYFDEYSGYWMESGTGTLTTTGNASYYEGEVEALDVWQADSVMETVGITGCVVDQNDEPVAGATVYASGLDYFARTGAVTDEAGQFSVAARSDSTALVSAFLGTQSQVHTVNTSQATNIETCLVVQPAASTIELSWGEHPWDLDSHLVGPSNEAGRDRFNLAYYERTMEFETVNMWLDVDDVTSFGPEVISISGFPFEGTYSYYVHHFSGSSDIAASPARVELSLRGATHVFSPPGGAAQECWHVFDLEVDSSLHPTVMPVNEWLSSSVCGDRQFPGTTSRQATRFSPALEGKYYVR